MVLFNQKKKRKQKTFKDLTIMLIIKYSKWINYL